MEVGNRQLARGGDAGKRARISRARDRRGEEEDLIFLSPERG